MTKDKLLIAFYKANMDQHHRMCRACQWPTNMSATGESHRDSDCPVKVMSEEFPHLVEKANS